MKNVNISKKNCPFCKKELSNLYFKGFFFCKNCTNIIALRLFKEYMRIIDRCPLIRERHGRDHCFANNNLCTYHCDEIDSWRDCWWIEFYEERGLPILREGT